MANERNNEGDNEQTNYQHTGNRIGVKKNEFIEHVFNQLAQYDHDSQTNPDESSYSPYSHPIVYKMPDERMVEVPKAIQAEAIQMYLEQKNQIINQQIERTPVKVKMMPVKVEPDNTYLYALLIIVLIAIGYALIKSNILE